MNNNNDKPTSSSGSSEQSDSKGLNQEKDTHNTNNTEDNQRVPKPNANEKENPTAATVDSNKKTKRSFSSYLSNIGQRKLELAEHERKKKEEEDARRKQEAANKEEEEKERLRKDQQEKQHREKEELERLELEKETRLSKEKSQKEREERERLYQEQKKKMYNLTEEREDPNMFEKAEGEFSTNKDEEGEPGIIAQGITGSSGTSTLSDLPDEKPSTGTAKTAIPNIPAAIPEHDDDDDDFSELEDPGKDLDSDTETVLGSPVKRRRGRLIRTSEMERKLKKNSTAESDEIEADEEDDSDNDDFFVDQDNDDEEAFSDHVKAPPKPTTSRQHLLSASRSVSPNSKSKEQQKPKKRTGRDSSGRQKLQRACDKGRYEEAKRLIKEGTDVNDQDYAGNSALHEASLNGYTDIVELLLENGAEVDLQSGPDDRDTPLIDAATNGHVDTVKMLLKYNADPRIENAHGQNALDSVDEDNTDSAEVLKSLLKKAAFVLQKKTKNSTSSVNASDNDHTDNHEEEHTRSRSKNRSHHQRTKSASTSTSRKDLLFVDLTSKSGRDEVYQRASDGDSAYVGTYLGNGGKADSEALALGAKYGHTDVVSLFLGFGAKVDVPNKAGMTALMRTVGRGHLEVVKLLIEHGADPLKKSKEGKTAFDYSKDALIYDQEEVKYLRDKIKETNGVDLGIPGPPETNAGDSKEGDVLETANEQQSDFNGRKIKVEADNELKEDHLDDIKIKKRKVSENDTIQGDNKKKKQHQEVRIELPKKESSPSVSYDLNSEIKSEDKRKKRVERSSSGTNVVSNQATVPRKVSQSAIETEDEKQLRLQKEKEEQKLREEYQSKLIEEQQKRQKKFLSQFESQELKKQEELKKLAEQEEERRIQQEDLIRKREKEEASRREMMNKEEERFKRMKIRNEYPYALKVGTFNNNRTKEECLQYLPLYSYNIDGIDYVTDIQIILILGLESFREKYSFLYEDESKIITLEEKAKIFKIIYSILRDRSPEARRCSFKEKLQTSHLEFKKLASIEIRWLKLEEVLKLIERDYEYLKDVVLSRVTKCEYNSNINESLVQLVNPNYVAPNGTTCVKVIDSRKQVQQMEAEAAKKLSRELPHSLRYRPAVIKALVRNRRLW